MASTKKLEERLKVLQRLPENKACFDCGHPGIQTSICLPFGIFICTSCSGLHRQFTGHQVYTISMTSLTEKIVSTMEQAGNAVNKERYLKSYVHGETQLNTPEAIKRFINLCFVQKIWSSEKKAPSTVQPVPSPSSKTSEANMKSAGFKARISSRDPAEFNDGFPDFINPSMLEQPRHVQTPSRASFSHDSKPISHDDRTSEVSRTRIVSSFEDLHFPGAEPSNQIEKRLIPLVNEQSRSFATMLIKHPTLSPIDFYTIIMSAAQITADAAAKKEASTSNAAPVHQQPTMNQPKSHSHPATIAEDDQFQADFEDEFDFLAISDTPSKPAPAPVVSSNNMPIVSAVEPNHSSTNLWDSFLDAQPTTTSARSSLNYAPETTSGRASLNTYGQTSYDPFSSPQANTLNVTVPSTSKSASANPTPSNAKSIQDTMSVASVIEDDEDDPFTDVVKKTQTPAQGTQNTNPPWSTQPNPQQQNAFEQSGKMSYNYYPQQQMPMSVPTPGYTSTYSQPPQANQAGYGQVPPSAYPPYPTQQQHQRHPSQQFTPTSGVSQPMFGFPQYPQYSQPNQYPPQQIQPQPQMPTYPQHYPPQPQVVPSGMPSTMNQAAPPSVASETKPEDDIFGDLLGSGW